jgi:hypothetical protein
VRDELAMKQYAPSPFSWISRRRKAIVTTSEKKAVENALFTLRFDERPVNRV